MSERNKILKERAELVSKIKKIQEDQGKEAAKLDTQYIKIKGRLQEILKTMQDSVDVSRESISGMVTLNDETNSLSSIYRNIKFELSEQVRLQGNAIQAAELQKNIQGELTENQGAQKSIVEDVLSSYTEQASLATQLSQLTEEDSVDRAKILSDMESIQGKLEQNINLLDERTKIAKDFLSIQGELENSISEQTKEAKQLSSLSSQQKLILEEQADAVDGMKKKFSALGETINTYLQRPNMLLGGLVIGLGFAVNKVAEVNKELGTTVLETDSASRSAAALSFFFNDAAGTVRALANEFGTIEKATFGAQLNVGLMASTMGISNTEAASLMGSFARMNNGSTDIASDMMETTKQFARQEGVIPNAAMADMAGSAETFALFAKEGGKNLIESAIGARKLGADLGTITNIAEGLLDFESSITKELELGAMLGKNINLNKARQLAYEGDLIGATQETLKQLGGIDAFNRMDYFQKKQTAELMGVSVAELQKMADNQKNISTSGAIINETFSKIGATVNAIATEYLGTGLKGLGGWITTTGQLGLGFSAMGTSIGGIVKGTGQMAKNLLGMLPGVGKLGSSLANSGIGRGIGTAKDKLFSGIGDKAKTVTDIESKTPSKSGSGLTGLSKGLKSMGTGKVLFGAMNLIPTALGMVAMIPALPGLGIIALLGAPAGVGLTALGNGLSTFGKTISKAGPAIWYGLGVLAAFGVAMIPLGFALGQAAPAISAFGDVVSSVFGGIATVVTAVMEGFIGIMGAVTPENLAGLFLLGPALLSASFGLMAFSTAMAMSSISSLFSGGIVSSISELTNLAPDLAITASALTTMGSALGMVATQLDRIDASKLDVLGDFSINASIGSVVSDIASGIGGMVESVSAIVGGDSLSNYETEMISQMKLLIVATNKNRDVFLDREKVTKIVMKTSEQYKGNPSQGVGQG